MIGAARDVKEAVRHEPSNHLRRIGIEMNQPGIVVERKRARRPVRRQELQRGLYRDAKPQVVRTNREVRSIRLDRVLEQHVQQPLRDHELGVFGQGRTHEVRERLIVRVERSIRWKRRLDGRDSRRVQPSSAFIQFEIVGDPAERAFAQQRIGPREVEKARPALRPCGLDNRRQGHADQHPQPLGFGFHEHLNPDVARDVVSPGARRQRGRATTRRRGQLSESGS